MQKIYLLLRNNQQTGPYTLNEILSLNLKPFDLVWEEGRSAAWRYPGEIQSLKEFVKPTPSADSPYEPVPTSLMETEQHAEVPVSHTEHASKKIFVSMPGKAPQVPSPLFSGASEEVTSDPIMEKAGTLTEKIQSYPDPSHYPSKQAVPSNKSMDTATNQSYTPDRSYYYRPSAKNKKTISKKNVFIAAFILLVTAVSYQLISKPEVQSIQAAAGTIAALPVEEESIQALKDHEPEPETPIMDNQGMRERTPVMKTGSEKVETRTNKKTVLKKNEQPDVNTIQPVIHEPVEENDNRDLTKKETSESIITEEKATTPKKEKKKLKDVVRGIFTRRPEKETDQPINQTPVPEEEPQRVTDRMAKKRENSFYENETDLSAVAEKIELSTHSPDNWMMGVSGLKVTLRNRNAISISSANVNVAYFDAHNKLLETKTIRFFNIPANGKTTMQAPDHKWADHTKVVLGSISVRKDVYAKD